MSDDTLDGDERDESPWRFFRSLVDRTPQPRPKTMLRDLYGRSRRDRTRPDTARAAENLGVSRRTVQRWVREDKIPVDRAGDLRAKWDNSSAGRKRRIDPAAQRTFVSGVPMVCTVEAQIQISNDRRNNEARPFTLTFEPDTSQALMQAMLAGDDDEAEQIWEKAIVDGFGGSIDLNIKNTKWGIKKS